MMKAILMASVVFALPVNTLADSANDALLRAQQRNAAVLGGLVNQTPEYQHGYTQKLEAVKEQEEATAERNQRWEEEATQEAASQPSKEREARNQKIDQLYKDMPHGKFGDRSKRETAQNQIDTLQRANGVYVPPRPERPKPPQMPSSISIGGKHYNCMGNQCY